VRKQLFGRRLNPEDRRKRLHELASRESFEARAVSTSATGSRS
jgi:hypothetical protein